MSFRVWAGGETVVPQLQCERHQKGLDIHMDYSCITITDAVQQQQPWASAKGIYDWAIEKINHF